MTKEEVINRIIRDMIIDGIIYEEDRGAARFHLHLLWNVSWEQSQREARRDNNRQRIVIRYKNKNQGVEEFPSIAIASKETKTDKNAIWKAIKLKRPTRKGYFWEYKK